MSESVSQLLFSSLSPSTWFVLRSFYPPPSSILVLRKCNLCKVCVVFFEIIVKWIGPSTGMFGIEFTRRRMEYTSCVGQPHILLWVWFSFPCVVWL